MTTTKNFLLAFNHSKNKQIELIDFGDNLYEAVEAYTAMEEKYSYNSRIHVLLVGSDSIETVKVTHSTYFEDGGKNLIDDLLNLALI